MFLMFCFLFLGYSEKLPFKNPNLPLKVRINDLISRLTLEEKASLMLYNSPSIKRLGISAYNWWNEALHGVARAGKATVFPQAIALAATFDENLIYKIGSAISDEARIKYWNAVRKGNHLQYAGLTFWSPNVNIFRDPRWGRGQETYGEDPFLTSRIGTAFVKGLQGNDKKYLKASACAKHFVVHSGPEATRHRFNAVPDIRDFYETYLYPFKILVKEGGVSGIMCAYNRTFGKPCCGSDFLLKKILRKKWGFNGYVTSDCWALDDIFKRHKYVKTPVEAAALAVKAGVDVNCGYVYKYIPEAVRKGLISENEVNRRVRELLKIRFLLGEFDPPENNPYYSLRKNKVNSPEYRKLAYKAAVESIVMLENKNETLPINLKKTKDILLTGPMCADIFSLLGNYNGYSPDLKTILEGIIDRVDEGTVVEYSQGFLLNDNSVSNFRGFWESKRADVVIACLGINSLYEGEEGDAILNPDGGDRKSLRLPENQIEYIRLLREKIKDKPLIVLITGGSAISIPEIRSLADAVLFVWYPGEEGGDAVADIIFGNANPSGRLPVTFYNSVRELPPFENYNMEGRTYRFFKGKPLYPFGYGLSYTNFEYLHAKLNKIIFGKNENIVIKLKIKNSGDFDGDEVVQIYAKKLKSKRFRPIKQLIGFKRVFLKSGEQKSVKIKASLEPLFYWDIKENSYEIEKGKYRILIGGSSEDIKIERVVYIR